MSATLSPLKAIRAKCVDCCGGSKSYVATCGIPDCPLYPYRLGKNPNRKATRVLTDEQKQAASERLKKAWKKRKNDKEDTDVLDV